MPDELRASCLYVGWVRHHRLRPVEHDFRYGVWTLYVDLDELPELDQRLPLLSFNRLNVFSFFERDHGPRDGSPLRPWIDRHLASQGVDLDGGPVRLLCFPRLFGYVFNPLSVWFCHDRGGTLRAVLLQVSNMSGEWHNYLFPVADPMSAASPSASFEKSFSVSAFTSMDARYECSIVTPEERFLVRIREFERDGETLAATWQGERRPLATRQLLAMLVRYPLLTFKIWSAIYWQAVQLLRKGVPRQPQGPRPQVEVSAPAGTRPRVVAHREGSGGNPVNG